MNLYKSPTYLYNRHTGHGWGNCFTQYHNYTIRHLRRKIFVVYQQYLLCGKTSVVCPQPPLLVYWLWRRKCWVVEHSRLVKICENHESFPPRTFCHNYMQYRELCYVPYVYACMQLVSIVYCCSYRLLLNPYWISFPYFIPSQFLVILLYIYWHMVRYSILI